MYLSYLSVKNTLEGRSNLSTKVSLDINSFEDSALGEISSEVELKEFKRVDSHQLNLVVAASCSIQYVRNVLNHIKELSFYFNFSESYQKMLELSIEKDAPDCLKKNLENDCRTRWVQQMTGLDEFENHFILVVFCLEYISSNERMVCNNESSVKALSFYELIASFDFL